MTERERFAQWLKERMLDRGLTALKVADQVDVPYPDTLDWVDGWSVPAPSVCRRLAALLDVPPDEVLRLAGWQSA